MLIVLGSILAGVLLCDHFVEKQVDPPRSTKEDASLNTINHYPA